jgi:hypothetical protein
VVVVVAVAVAEEDVDAGWAVVEDPRPRCYQDSDENSHLPGLVLSNYLYQHDEAGIDRYIF